MLLFSVAGLVIGSLAAIRVANKVEPVELVYYDVRHTLIVSEDVERGINLEQAAFFASIGVVPDTVAEQIGADPEQLATQVQTVTNQSLRTIVVSVVASTSEDATLLTTAFATGLIDFLQAEDVAVYEAQLAEARSEVDRFALSADDIDSQIEALDERIFSLEAEVERAAGETDATEAELDAATAQVAQLRSDRDLLASQRNGELTRVQSATEAFDSLASSGAPSAPLSTLDISEPQRVSERERDRRVADGREGQANYVVGSSEIPTGGGGGGISSSLLDSPTALLVGGTLAGLLLGLLTALVMARLDHRILNREDAEHHFGMPVLAEVPRLRSSHRKVPIVVSHTDPMSPVAEAYRGLRSSLLYARDFGEVGGELPQPQLKDTDGAPPSRSDRAGTVVLVTSPGASEGKTSTVANLANVLAEEDYEVLAVNCDFRRPRLAFFLDADHEPRRLSKTNIAGVRLINHVTEEDSETRPTEVIRAQKRVITEGRERFDAVLLDTAPLLLTNDTNEILSAADLVIIVAQVGRTTRESAEATREILERRRTPVAGVVLIGGDTGPRSPGYYYYQSDLGRPRLNALRWRRRQHRDSRYRSGGRSDRRVATPEVSSDELIDEVKAAP